MFVSDSNADVAAWLGWLGCLDSSGCDCGCGCASSLDMGLEVCLDFPFLLRAASMSSIPLHSTRHFPPGESIQFAYNLRSFYFISPTAICHLYAWVLAFTRGVASAYPQFIDSSISISSGQKLFKSRTSRFRFNAPNYVVDSNELIFRLKLLYHLFIAVDFRSIWIKYR